MWKFVERIIKWFGEIKERNEVVKQFNKTAEQAFITGESPMLFKANIKNGCFEYRHSLSKSIGSGFVITVHTTRELKIEDIVEIGNIITSSQELARKLIVLGWDTLYVETPQPNILSYRWRLSYFANMGGELPKNE